jgi:hypothetical protein
LPFWFIVLQKRNSKNHRTELKFFTLSVLLCWAQKFQLGFVHFSFDIAYCSNIVQVLHDLNVHNPNKKATLKK